MTRGKGGIATFLYEMYSRRGRETNKKNDDSVHLASGEGPHIEMSVSWGRERRGVVADIDWGWKSRGRKGVCDGLRRLTSLCCLKPLSDKGEGGKRDPNHCGRVA